MEAALLASDKERSEHRAVVDAILDGLAPAMASLSAPDEPGHRRAPERVPSRHADHAGTSPPVPTARFRNALELLALIHPTPAVAGTPADLALDYLAKAEEVDRDRYAGAVGGSTATGTASGTSASAAPSSPAAPPGCSPASASARFRPACRAGGDPAQTAGVPGGRRPALSSRRRPQPDSLAMAA